MRHMHRSWIAVALAAPLLLGGCTSAPRVRAVKMGPVEGGTDTIEAVRRQLEGTWELVTLDTVSPSGEKKPVRAQGRLTYDKFGNMSMRGTVTDPNIDQSALNVTGRVTIDPGAHTLKFASIKAPTADESRLDPKLDLALVRYYEFEGDLLRTTLKTP